MFKQLAQSHRAGTWQGWGSNARTLLPEPAVPIIKLSINYLQAICHLAGVQVPETVTLGIKDLSLNDRIREHETRLRDPGSHFGPGLLQKLWPVP